MTTMGKRIKHLRQELQLSQEKFGEIFNSGKAYISAVENDKSKLSVENLVKLLVDYNVNINYILAGVGEMFINSGNTELSPELEAAFENLLKRKGLI